MVRCESYKVCMCAAHTRSLPRKKNKNSSNSSSSDNKEAMKLLCEFATRLCDWICLVNSLCEWNIWGGVSCVRLLFFSLFPSLFLSLPLFAMCIMYYDRLNHPYKMDILDVLYKFCLHSYCACAPNILRFLCIHKECVCFVYIENYPDKNTRVFRLFSFGCFSTFFFSMLNFSLCLTLNCAYAQGKPTFDLVNMGTKIENI